MKTLVAVCFATICGLSLNAYAGTTGSIRGVVTEAGKKTPLGGVTVVATSRALQGEEVVLTDDRGRYELSRLPPGSYNVQFVFAGVVVDRPNVTVSVDKTVAINAELNTTSAQSEVYTIQGTAPSVDVSSSTLGLTLTKDFILNVPQGRSRNFDESLRVLPSAVNDDYGVSVGGASSPENAYMIDGLNTTDPAYGLMGSRLVLDFIDQFDVKEGGYAAEYGRATGAFVNIVTKSGGNELHGTVFMYYRPGWMEAKPRTVARSGEAISERLKLNYYMNPGFELGGPIIADKLWFHVGYAPEFRSDRWTRRINAIRVDRDGNAVIEDGIVQTDPTDSKKQHRSIAVAHQFTLKLTHAINDKNRHSLGIRGAPTTFEGVRNNPFNPNTRVLSLNASPETYRYKETMENFDVTYNYGGKFFGDKLEVEAWAGWHRNTSSYEPRADVSGNPTIIWQTPRRLRDFQADVPAECQEDADLADGSSRCMVENFESGGIGQGLLRDLTKDRFSERLAGTYLFEFAGLHRLKLGTDFEQNFYRDTRSYSGGGVYFYNPTVGVPLGDQDLGAFVGQQFFDGDLSKVANGIDGEVGSRNYAVFLQDSWNPTSALTLNYGVRWEAQEFYGPNKDRTEQENKFGIYDNIAPRLGVVWDFLGGGKSRAFAHWGRFYESVPVNLVDRYFAGEGLRVPVFNAAACERDEQTIDFTEVTDPQAQCKRTYLFSQGGYDMAVAPGLKGQYNNETIVGAEAEVFPSWVFGISGIHRSLGRAIEDITTSGGKGVLANPGDFDSGRLEALDEQIARESDPDKKARLADLRGQVNEINNFPRAKRNFWGLQFTVDKKLSQSFLMRFSYLLSRVTGNYSGLYGQALDPNVTTLFDFPHLLANSDGPLPTDRTHRFKVDGYYQFDFERLGFGMPLVVTTGASARLISGAPIDAYGADATVNPVYDVFLIKRGGGGRTPWTSSADVHLAARHALDSQMGVEVFVDLFNVYNAQITQTVDNTYTSAPVVPIKGGGKADLEHARDASGSPVRKNPNYGQPTSFQAPFSGQLGARLFF